MKKMLNEEMIHSSNRISPEKPFWNEYNTSIRVSVAFLYRKYLPHECSRVRVNGLVGEGVRVNVRGWVSECECEGGGGGLHIRKYTTKRKAENDPHVYPPTTTL